MPAGRPATPTSIDDYREEVTALRAEARELAAEIIPLSRYLFQRGAINGDEPTRDVALRVTYLLERSARRNGDDAA